MIKASRKIAERHYEEHIGRTYFNELINYITEERLVALILEGENIVQIVRQVNGDKDPLKSELASVRGKYSNHKTRNLVHASDSYEHAEREMRIWFPEF
jgi:nucleoside-diphosphate kinase